MRIPDKYKVISIKAEYVKEWFLKKHYAKRIPSISYCFALQDENNLTVGVCSFGTPASSTLLKGVCGVKFADYVIELNRLITNDNLKRNTCSFFLSQCLKKIPQPKIIVSYADTSQNHNGYIYQATNFIYTGLSSRFLDPKVIGLEHLHHATYANGLNNKELKEKYGDKLYYQERARKHRYIYFLGNKSQVKLFKKELRYDIQEYPKGINRNYDASYNPSIQLNLL